MNKSSRVLAAALTATLVTANSVPAFAAGASNDTTTTALPADSAVAGIALSISEYKENADDAGKGLSEVMSQATTEAAKTDEKAETAKKTEKKTTKSAYDNIAITRVSNYVNIRSKATTDSKVVGKIHNNAAATILKTVDGEDGKWYYIKSGSVKGYMKAEFFVTGEKAEKIAKKVGNVLCKTTATTLRLREKASTKSDTVALLAEGSTYSVLKESVKNKKGEEFIKVLVSESEDGKKNVEGYISADYAKVYVKFDKAISIEEEQAELKRQADLKKKEQEAARQAAAEKTSSKSSSRSSSSSSKKSSSSSSSRKSSSSYSSKSSGTGSAIAAKAQQYAGWLPYVWGGSSLSSGADCSGFTMAIYASYGISLPHSAASQAGGGRSISRSELQPGDLVFYGKGGISHVGIYIGGGQICHEANSRRDCVIDSIGYCGTPVKYVTYTH